MSCRLVRDQRKIRSNLLLEGEIRKREIILSMRLLLFLPLSAARRRRRDR